MNYYAVCDANGPISVNLGSERLTPRGFAEWCNEDGRAAIDNCSTDAEDEMSIAGDGMTEGEFAAALEEAGCTVVHSTEVHGDWVLWVRDDD